ncbi:MAG: aromatic ring-hydroxylating dioxygenase subunit alpha [Pseudomonadota bacterium]
MDQIYKRPDPSADMFDADAGRSYTLPAWMYYEPETLSEERDAIFLKSWIYVAHSSELKEPGHYVTAEIVDQRIYVIRTRAGDLKAFFNVCQHRGHSLLRGKGKARNLLVCPYHSWSYDHDGALRAAPNCEHVTDFDKGAFSLPEVRVEEFAGFVFVNLDPEARPMREVYPGAEERLLQHCPDAAEYGTAREIVFDIKGNWKNVGDNLLECYHCSTAHKAFVDLVEMPTYTVETYDNWSIQWGECRSSNTAYEFDAASAVTSNVTLYLWPTLAFAQFPGTGGIATFSFLPTAPEVTHQVFAYHGAGGTITDTAERALDYFQDVLGPEDVSLVEDVQKGLHSLGYHQGRFMVDQNRSAISELAVHHFQNRVARSLGMV